ncbi:MAG: carbohydrate binding family 9 domain-containing protein [bacterium]|nr:carbohydrate binding family 9 domain-containing protein [bacterium]
MTYKLVQIVTLFISIIFLLTVAVPAMEVREGGKTLIPDLATGPVKIDGDLSETVWSKPALSKQFLTFTPVYGDKLKLDTDIWMAYDKSNLYFAFKCYDDEPGKLKTSIAQRDKMYGDDWVGIVIDTTGTKQTGYEFYCNPNGIQGDSLNSAVSGTDSAPDFVFETSAKITEEGYQVEMRIPLESIRFKSGKEVRMGILFLRNISRFGTAGAWPKTQPGQTDFNFMTTVIYKDLKQGLKLEMLPNITYSRNVERESPDSWGDSDKNSNIGAAVKYGLTSSITAEATVNPDFSQVESDAFQVEVNRRFPLFFSEKRPFFMEGTDVFDFGIVDDGMMRAAVHTRHIVDPGWAGKVSGSTGKTSFALLAANDQFPGRFLGGGVSSYEGRNTFWGLARGKFNIGSDNSLGFLYSGRHFAGNNNNVLGVDLKYRFFKNIRFTLSYLHSITSESEDETSRTGSGLNVQLQYLVPGLISIFTFEHYSDDFTMESAFMNRGKLSRGQAYIAPNIYTKTKKLPWIKNLQPFIYYTTLHDLETGLDDTTWILGVRVFFSKPGFFRFDYRDLKEGWAGQLFHYKYLRGFITIQALKWLTVKGSYRRGTQIFYDPLDPFLGRGSVYNLGIVFQPDVRLNLDLSLTHQDLNRETDNQELYRVNVFNLLTTYQFNKYFFLRGAFRYNDFQKKILTDFLASFTLIPGTVMHLGYGSIYEKRGWEDDRWLPRQGNFINVRNGLFFKVSYLWQVGK